LINLLKKDNDVLNNGVFSLLSIMMNMCDNVRKNNKLASKLVKCGINEVFEERKFYLYEVANKVLFEN